MKQSILSCFQIFQDKEENFYFREFAFFGTTVLTLFNGTKRGAAFLVIHRPRRSHRRLLCCGASRSPGSPLPGGALPPEIQKRAAFYLGCRKGRGRLPSVWKRASASENSPVKKYTPHILRGYVWWKKCDVPWTLYLKKKQTKPALNWLAY